MTPLPPFFFYLFYEIGRGVFSALFFLQPPDREKGVSPPFLSFLLPFSPLFFPFLDADFTKRKRAVSFFFPVFLCSGDQIFSLTPEGRKKHFPLSHPLLGRGGKRTLFSSQTSRNDNQPPPPPPNRKWTFCFLFLANNCCS